MLSYITDNSSFSFISLILGLERQRVFELQIVLIIFNSNIALEKVFMNFENSIKIGKKVA